MTAQFPDSWRETIAKWASQNPRIAKILVYGSRARGDASPSSDLDLALSFTPDSANTPAGLWICTGNEMAAELQRLLPVKLDLRCDQHPGADEEWLEELARDGKIIFIADRK